MNKKKPNPLPVVVGLVFALAIGAGMVVFLNRETTVEGFKFEGLGTKLEASKVTTATHAK